MSVGLRARASANFEKYMNAFLTTGQVVGLPASRLMPQEWAQLNDELKYSGVKLVPGVKNGVLYYWFSKYVPSAKKDVFLSGTDGVKQKLFSVIKQKYPNLADYTVRNIIETGDNVNDIYELLRHRDNAYTGISFKQYHHALQYMLMSSKNKLDMLTNADYHRWEPDDSDWDCENRSVRGQSWPHDMWFTSEGFYQGWTWFRKLRGNTQAPIRDSKNPDGYHVSLNVNISAEMLMALDDIVMQDAGRHINMYKIPKLNKYGRHVVSRHDPVTIYLYSRNPVLEQRIASAMRPFVRSNEGLIGRLIGYGVDISPETSSMGLSVGEKAAQDIALLISRANIK